MMYRILIVEDDPSIAAGLSYALEKEGYFVTQCRSVAEAFEVSEAVHFDLAVLDMQLPDGVGKEIGQKLQAEQTQVIYLTVVDDEDEIVHTLENGAADYVTKPFRMRELMVRIRRILNIKTEEQQVIRLGDAVIDANAGKVFVKDQQILLTALEYRLLLIFAENPSILLTREQLLERIWDISGDFVEDNTLTVYVKRLRKKLGDAVQISTVRGRSAHATGYRGSYRRLPRSRRRRPGRNSRSAACPSRS